MSNWTHPTPDHPKSVGLGLEPGSMQLWQAAEWHQWSLRLGNHLRKVPVNGFMSSHLSLSTGWRSLTLEFLENLFQSLLILLLVLEGHWVVSLGHPQGDTPACTPHHFCMGTAALQPTCPLGQAIWSACPLGLSCNSIWPIICFLPGHRGLFADLLEG